MSHPPFSRLAAWLFCLALCVPAALSHAQNQEEGLKDLKRVIKDVPAIKKQALVVGIGKYDKCTQLSFTVKDATKFAEFLETTWGFDRDNITLMTDDAPQQGTLRPTFVNLSDQVDLLEKGLRNDSELIIFYSGHGLRLKEQDYLVPIDGNPERIERTCISITELRNKIEGKSPKRAVLFIDACRDVIEGKGGPPNQFGAETEAKPPRQPQIAFLYSCQPGEKSREGKGDDFKFGVFTKYLLDGLGGAKEAADPATGQVTFDTLRDFVRGRVSTYVKKQFNASQNPLGLASFGAMVFTQAFPPPEPEKPKIDPKMVAQGLVNDAYQLLFGNKLLQANDKARDALKLDPDNANAHHILGIVFLRNKQYEDALQALTAAKKLNPNIPGLDTVLQEAQLGANPQGGDVQVGMVLRDADAAFRQNDLKKAEALANVVIHLRKDATPVEKAQAHAVLGQVFEKDGKTAEALKAYQDSLQLQENHPIAKPAKERIAKMLQKQDVQAKINEALQLLEDGNLTQADLRAREVIAQEPENARAYYVRGRVLYAQTRYDEAIRDFETALKHDSTLADAARYKKDAEDRRNERVVLVLAQQAQELLGRSDLPNAEAKAKEVLDRKTQNVPANGLAHYVLGAVYEKLGRNRYQDALREYQEALRLEPGRNEARAGTDRVLKAIGEGDLQLLVTESQRLFQANDLPAAESKAREAIAREPGNAAAHFVLAQVHERRGSTDDAVREYQEARRLDPTLAAADQAIQALQQKRNQEEAVRLAPTAYGHLSHGEWVEAITKSRRAVELDPKNALARGVLGNALLWLADYKNGDREIQAAEALDANLPLVHVGRGVRLFLDAERERGAGRAAQSEQLYDQAVEAFKRAVSLKPDELLAHNNLGAAYYGRGRLKEAEDECKKALQLDPGYPFAYFNLASVYFDNKDWKAAEENYQKAIDKAPDNAYFYASLAAALFGQKRIPEARTQAAKARARGLRPSDHFIFGVLDRQK